MLLPLIGIIIWGKSFPQRLYPLIYLIIFWVISQFLMSFYYLIGLDKTTPIVNIGIVLELPLVTYVYWKYYFSKKESMVYFIMNFLFIIFAAIQYSNHGLYEYGSSVRSIQSLIVASLAIGFFIKLILAEANNEALDNLMFWFSSGVLMFFTGNVLFILFQPSIDMMGKNINYIIYSAYDFLNVIFNIFIFIGILRFGLKHKNI